MNKKIEKTLLKIEQLEKTWEMVQRVNQKNGSRIKRVVKFWSVPRTTGEFLRFLVTVSKSKKILELGCSAGYSTLFLASGLRNELGHVYSIENMPEKVVLAKKHMKEAGMSKKVTVIDQYIANSLDNWRYGTVDFVFIDAEKNKYLFYYEKIFPLLSSGGIIVADNAGNYGYRMKPFLKTVANDKRVFSYFHNIDNGLLLIYKK